MFNQTTPRITRLALATLLLATAPLSACGETQVGDPSGPAVPGGELIKSDLQRETAPQVPDADLATQVEANTTFAFDAFRQIAASKPGENLVYSPYSVSSALAMTYAGARGDTAAEMAEALHFSLAQDELHPVFNHLDLELESRGQDATGQDGQPFRLEVANALWGREGLDFEADFLDTLAVHYGAGLQALDFVGDAEGARQIINAWVEAETEERIQDLLPEGTITPSTALVLTNAIYFNAAWASPFDEARTTDGAFTLADGSTVTTPMMHQNGGFLYAALEAEELEAIELPYDGNEVSMLVLVPEDLAVLESALTPQLIIDVDAALAAGIVDLSMPKFEVESTVSFTDVLKAMGMEAAFDAQAADFGGMTTEADIFISEVLHKAFVNLDEHGTEAAAATAVVGEVTSAPGGEPVVLSIDQPFLYLIRDNATGAILFVGRVMDPTT